MPLNPTLIHLPDKNTGGIDTVKEESVGPQRFVMQDRFFASGVADDAGVASLPLSALQPIRSIITEYSIKSLSVDLDVGTASATHLAFGIAGDLDEFAETAVGNLESNEEIFGVPSDTQAIITAARVISVFATTTGGSASGTLDNYDLLVTVWGRYLPKIKDG